ncbi:uncharacterized protein TRIADDRAFT_56844 [Trichoplax adhaerens]|uniref:Uncharacterized protein n=1 Tax=Trichoplax adhaerens TaxID=10228 RepID=B3RWQ9_TRIAD|nr:hypothetical protein TRIADDRAFT_56844 [Trichoplax adhaerens]EDV24740.1 hypothetical protein TRIADDRAFT_56844 [Trichoplax adhaerens]|eukprot:XP_002112630.1 hypothetical protein TRIADDRAFT_56844 [Trichoplax adhaerens]
MVRTTPNTFLTWIRFSHFRLVVLHSKNLKELAANRSNVTIVKLDASDKQSIENLVAVIKEKLGIGAPGKLLQVTNEDLIRVYQTNAYHFLIIKAGKKKGFAAMINITSWLESCGQTPVGKFYPYGLSKAVMNRLTKGLSIDLIGDNVIAISMNPG